MRKCDDTFPFPRCHFRLPFTLPPNTPLLVVYPFLLDSFYLIPKMVRPRILATVPCFPMSIKYVQPGYY